MSVSLTSASGQDGMRYLECLMEEVGVRSVASSSLLSVAASPSSAVSAVKSSKPLVHSHARDCLDQNPRNAQQQSRVEYSSVRRSPSPSSMIKGALMFGRDDHADSRYYGGSASAPLMRSESPGPIYDPPLSSFDPHHGISFSKAPKRTIDTQSMGSEELVLLPGSIGKQVLSSFSSASTASFPRSNRFNSKLYVSRIHHDQRGLDSPAPTAYQPSDMSTNEGHGAVLCGGRVSTAKVFISRAHTADCIGLESPGPVYHPDDGAKKGHDGLAHPFDKSTSSHPKGPAFSFTGSRSTPSLVQTTTNVEVANATCRCHIEKDEQGKVHRLCVHSTVKPGSISREIPTEPFISHEHSKVQSTANTPGPAFYNPGSSFGYLEEGPRVSFTKAKLDAGTDRRSSLSPGPKYNPSDSYVTRNVSSSVFGSRLPHEDRNDRFTENQFLGKDFSVGAGKFSPGPIYDPKIEASIPTSNPVTMSFKEKVYDKKKLFPGPLRNRYIGPVSARENFGCYSPGPKYDTRGDISHEGVAFSIPKSAKLGQQNPHSSLLKDDEADQLAASSDPTKPPLVKKAKKQKTVLLYPKDDYLSTTVAGPQVRISPNPTSVARKRPDDADATAETKSPPPEIHPSFALIETQYPAVSFSKNSRLPPTRQSVQPGPTQYTPNFVHVESRAPAVTIGIL